MTLLRLYRKHPEVIPSGEWAERIVSIMDDDNLVSLSNSVRTCESTTDYGLLDPLFNRECRLRSRVWS